MIKLILFYAYILIGSAVLFVNIYSSIIDSWIWGSHIPGSIEIARNYFKEKTPGDFFKIFGTATHIVGFLLIILFWQPNTDVRWLLILSVILFIVVDVFTLIYFIPRNDIMFKQASLTDIEKIRQAWKQWSTMNWLRSAVALAGVVAICIALHKTYKT